MPVWRLNIHQIGTHCYKPFANKSLGSNKLTWEAFLNGRRRLWKHPSRCAESSFYIYNKTMQQAQVRNNNTFSKLRRTSLQWIPNASSFLPNKSLSGCLPSRCFVLKIFSMDFWHKACTTQIRTKKNKKFHGPKSSFVFYFTMYSPSSSSYHFYRNH